MAVTDPQICGASPTPTPQPTQISVDRVAIDCDGDGVRDAMYSCHGTSPFRICFPVGMGPDNCSVFHLDTSSIPTNINPDTFCASYASAALARLRNPGQEDANGNQIGDACEGTGHL